jgi:hypothetical protein
MSTANTGPLTMFPAATNTVSATTPAPTTNTVTVSMGTKATVTVTARKITAADMQDAIYTHIQAVRALGKTKITPEEIARALELPVSTVEGAISTLKNKGVKVIHHG